MAVLPAIFYFIKIFFKNLTYISNFLLFLYYEKETRMV
jgi:hypothetical protein